MKELIEVICGAQLYCVNSSACSIFEFTGTIGAVFSDTSPIPANFEDHENDEDNIQANSQKTLKY